MIIRGRGSLERSIEHNRQQAKRLFDDLLKTGQRAGFS
jgi:hypothetical protein